MFPRALLTRIKVHVEQIIQTALSSYKTEVESYKHALAFKLLLGELNSYVIGICNSP